MVAIVTVIAVGLLCFVLGMALGVRLGTSSAANELDRRLSAPQREQLRRWLSAERA